MSKGTKTKTNGKKKVRYFFNWMATERDLAMMDWLGGKLNLSKSNAVRYALARQCEREGYVHQESNSQASE